MRSSVLQERPEEHCSVREVESFHNSSHHVELEDCFKLYTKDEKVSQGQTMNFKNFLNMLFGKSWKTKLTSLRERTAQQLSFELSHFRISSTDSKVRTTLYSIIKSATGKYCSVAFI